jgi:hypothetical protein
LTVFPFAQLDKLADGSSVTYTQALAADGNITIPKGVMVTAGGTLDVPDGKSFVIKGVLMAEGDVSLSGPVTIDDTGGFGLATTKTVTLTTGVGKIVGSTYSIANSDTETSGTVGAGVTNTLVVFKAARIDGYTTSGVAIVGDNSATTAATLALGGTGTVGPVFAVTGNTAVGGVILDVATKGVIKVTGGKTLTLEAGADSDSKGSGGIFTAAVTGGTPVTVVKANGATLKSDGAFNGATVLAGAKVEAKAAAGIGAAGDVGTGATNIPVADGVITGAADGTSIDKNDTFSLSGGAVVPAGVPNA